MSGFKIIGVLASLIAAAVVVPASAHHALQAVFDTTKMISVSGPITKVEWINPHSYITVDGKSKTGKAGRWAFEFGGTGVLHQSGMSRTDRGGLKPGDMVTIEGFPAKDGSTTGFVQKLQFPDGRVFVFRTNDPNAR
jgi:Family of unknown function (DUF6152)